MKVKDLIPLIKSDVELVTKENGEYVSVCDSGKYTEPMLEAEIKEVFMTGYAITIEIGYDEKFFIKQKDIDKLPDTIWVMMTEYDNPIPYYFKSDAKKAYGNHMREKYDWNDEIREMSDDEIWDTMDDFDTDYVIEQIVIK